LKVPISVERTFTANADEQIVRNRLVDGMRKLGFSIFADRDYESEFERGSPFADEPSYLMNVRVRFDPPKNKQLVAVLILPVVLVGTLVDFQGWTGVNEYYASILPLVEQIASSNSPSFEPFLDLSKRVGRNMILLWTVVTTLITADLAYFLLQNAFESWSWWVNVFSGLVLLIFFLIRIGADIYGIIQINGI
jgi:hypothetical protein